MAMLRPYSLYLLALVFLGCSHPPQAQPYQPDKVSKKALALFTQAQQRAAEEHYASAVGLLQQAISLEPRFADAHLALASVYGQLKNYRLSVQHYEQAFAIDSTYTLDYKQAYASRLAGLGEFQRALDALDDLLQKKPPKSPAIRERLDKLRQSCLFAVTHARKQTDTLYVFAPVNLGPGVNSSESEYFPTLSLEGGELVFTRRVNNRNEDFYLSTLEKDKWQPAAPLPGKINTPMSEAAQTLSADGQWLFFTARDRRDSYGGYDLYFSYRTPLGWSEGENMGQRVNSDQWDSQPCLSPDKKELYFASRRPGGLGGSDIYVTRYQNGQWSRPENLGPGINTAGDDQCPFIHADNETLFFTSNGWPGYGANDLFVSRKSGKGKWSQPENLGYPINTVDDEGTLFIAADGKTAFYASDRSDSRGGLDLYSFELRQGIRPAKTLWVKGRITDAKTGSPLSATVELVNLDTREPLQEVSAGENGEFLITLPAGKDYAFLINRKGYFFHSEQFLLAGQPADSTYEKIIRLQPIEAQVSRVLKHVYFETNQFSLQPASEAELDKLVQLLRENPGIRLEISGHTDNVGRPADNLALSNNRAQAVVNYLISHSIDPARLQAKGYGATKPIAPNESEEGRAQNRRTEMKVL